MVKETNKRVMITLSQKDYERLEFCKELTGLSFSNIYRLALIDFYLKERKEKE